MRALLLFFCLSGAEAHRLDEYLQATVLSLEVDRIRGELRLTPGVAVLPAVLAEIDTDRSGLISAAEAHAYAQRVVAALELSLDGRRRGLQLIALRFPTNEQLREGLGEIQVDFATTGRLDGSGSHELAFQNSHLRMISTYLVNCLAPQGDAFRIDNQQRSYEQTEYRLRYTRSGGFGTIPAWTGVAAFALILKLLVSSKWARKWRRLPTARSGRGGAS